MAESMVRLFARSGLAEGLSEQPVGHTNGIRDLEYDALSRVITGFVNILLVLRDLRFVIRYLSRDL